MRAKKKIFFGVQQGKCAPKKIGVRLAEASIRSVGAMAPSGHVVGHTKFYLGSIKGAKLAWPKVERPREVRKERFFVSSQRTPLTKEKNQENLERHELDMAARYARFIFVREGVFGTSILGFLSL